MSDGQPRFKPPFKLDHAFDMLSSEDQITYIHEMFEWIRQEGAKHNKPRDFSRVTAENIQDLVDDTRGEISRVQRESLKQDVLSGRVMGTIDEEGIMHLGQGPVVRQPADE